MLAAPTRERPPFYSVQPWPCVRLVARARGPLRELQPDGLARFGSAARFSFVYCGARQVSRRLAGRDCDGRDRAATAALRWFPGFAAAA